LIYSIVQSYGHRSENYLWRMARNSERKTEWNKNRGKQRGTEWEIWEKEG